MQVSNSFKKIKRKISRKYDKYNYPVSIWSYRIFFVLGFSKFFDRYEKDPYKDHLYIEILLSVLLYKFLTKFNPLSFAILGLIEVLR